MKADAPTLLKNFRADNSLTLEAASALVGVSKAAWHRWESGDRKIDSEIVPIVADKTGIPAADLRPDIMSLAKKFGEAAE